MVDGVRSSLEIVANGPLRPATTAWRDALAPVILRHPNGWSRVVLRLACRSDVPRLHISIDANPCTITGALRRDFAISEVRLTYFPGERLARAWIACVWSGFLMHEALELVTVGDLATKVLDPHAEPYPSNPFNRPLRDTVPPDLTPATLHAAFAVVMGDAAARAFVEAP